MAHLYGEKIRLLLEDEQQCHSDEHASRRSTGIHKTMRCVSTSAYGFGIVILLFSIVTNIALLSLMFKAFYWKTVPQDDSGDKHASWLGIKHDHPRLWWHNTLYSVPNISESDTNWINMDIDYNTIALSKSEVDELNLPPAMEVPWAPGYMLYGVSPLHALHCLKYLHRSNFEYRYNLPQTYPPGHLIHCFDTIRQEITCVFDDMPLGLPLTAPGPNTQYRYCKDWSKLEKFAKEHAQCISAKAIASAHKKGSNDVFPDASRYCPPESPLLPSIREYFQKPDDWLPVRAPPGLPEVPGARFEGYEHGRSAVAGF